MPRLHTIGNVQIRVYPDDTKKHRMPHFHAASPEGDMVVSLPDLQVIAGSLKDRAAVLEWARIEANLERLMVAWDQGNPTVPVRRSRP
nr:DUF4160 domain-containing protein [Rhodopila globiformis]